MTTTGTVEWELDIAQKEEQNRNLLSQFPPPNPEIITSTHYTLHNRLFLALHLIVPFLLRKTLI